MTETTRAIALLAALTLPAPPAPDIVIPPPPGTRRVMAAIRIRLAAPDGPWIVGHRIVDGDTFAGLAQRRLGDVGLVGWVAGLNPGVDPRRLQRNQLVWLPRRGAIGAVDAPLVYVDTSQSVYRMSAEPLVPDQDEASFRSTLLLVAQAHQHEFESCVEQSDLSRFRELTAAGHVNRVVLAGAPDELVPNASQVAQIEVTASLRSGPDGRPSLESDAVRYLDAEGAEVAAPPPAPQGWSAVGPEPDAPYWWLVLLAGGAAVVLLLVAVRRARSAGGP